MLVRKPPGEGGIVAEEALKGESDLIVLGRTPACVPIRSLSPRPASMVWRLPTPSHVLTRLISSSPVVESQPTIGKSKRGRARRRLGRPAIIIRIPFKERVFQSVLCSAKQPTRTDKITERKEVLSTRPV